MPLPLETPRLRIRPFVPRDLTAIHELIGSDPEVQRYRHLPVAATVDESRPFFEILACARPIVASVRGESRRIFERSQGALVVDPEDAAAIAGAILRLEHDHALRTELGQSGRRFVLAEYDRRVLADRYLDILGDACSQGRQGDVARSSRS